MRRAVVALVLAWASCVAAMPADVLRVIDGDTLLIDAALWLHAGEHAQRMRAPLAVRVYGIDTPELRAKTACEREMARRAREFVVGWIGGERVDVEFVGLDKYGGRVDAHVTRDGASLADALVAAGLARAYGRGARGAWCQ